MPRLMIFSSEFPPGPGGIGTHAFQVARHFAGVGWSVRVVSPQDYASDEEVAGFNAVQPFTITRLPVRQCKPWQSLLRLRSFGRALRAFQPDLVLASGGRAIWLSALLLPLRQIPWVLVGHGSEFGARTGWGARLTRLSGNRADAAICVSHYTRAALEGMGITRPPIHVIHNGADHTCFFPLPEPDVTAFRNAQAVSGKFVLLTVGNVSARKGQAVMICALPTITKTLPQVQYWMAGLPQQQAELTALAESLGVADQIRFWGRVSHQTLLRLYNACDLFVMTSRQLADGDFEGYGIAVIEAALCGKAALASDNSGLAEAVQHGQTGLLVPQNDPQATAEAVLALAGDRQGLARLSRAAHQNALENQTWAQVGERYRAVLAGVLAAENRGAR